MKLDIPQEYKSARESLPYNEVGFGCGGIELYPVKELPKLQVGYAVSPKGKSLTDGQPGSWEAHWIVVGHETACGDPIFLDTSTGQVLTAMHGEGSWEPTVVATSINSFFASLKEFKQVSIGREHPVGLEQNPLKPGEATTFLSKIRRLNGKGFDSSFWELLLELEM